MDPSTLSVDVHVWEDEDQTKIFIKKVWLEDDTINLIWRDANKAIEKKLKKAEQVDKDVE
jgi:hypothetical protein